MKGELLALAAMPMFASNIIVTRLASSRIAISDGYLIVVSVNISFSALVFAVRFPLRAEPLRWDSWGFVLFVLAGVFATYLGRWFNMESIVRLGPAKTSAFQVSSPLFALVFALVFLGERLSLQALVAMLLTASGLLLVSLPRARATTEGTTVLPAPGIRDRVRAGIRSTLASTVAMAVGSSAAYAIGNVLRGAAVRQWNEPVLGALIGALAGIALHFVFASGHVEVVRNLRRADRRGVLLFGLSGVLTIVAQMCVFVAMVHSPIAVVALITLCTPVVVFPLSYFLLGNNEGITARTIAGAILTIGGIAMIILL